MDYVLQARKPSY